MSLALAKIKGTFTFLFPVHTRRETIRNPDICVRLKKPSQAKPFCRAIPRRSRAHSQHVRAASSALCPRCCRWGEVRRTLRWAPVRGAGGSSSPSISAAVLKSRTPVPPPRKQSRSGRDPLPAFAALRPGVQPSAFWPSPRAHRRGARGGGGRAPGGRGSPRG